MAAKAQKPTSLRAAIEDAPEPPPRSRRGKPDQTVPVPGLELYAALSTLQREIEDGFLALARGPVRAKMVDRFVAEGLEVGHAPANFKGAEGLGKASLQLKMRSARSPLAPEQVALLDELEIPYTHEIEKRETFLIKPDIYEKKPELVDAMLDCLTKNGFDTREVFVRQRETYHDIVAPNTLDELFRKAREARGKRGNNRFTDAQLRQLLEICATLAIRPDWEGTIQDALGIFLQHLDGETDLPTPKKGPFPNDLEEALTPDEPKGRQSR